MIEDINETNETKATRFDRLAAAFLQDLIAKREYPVYHHGQFYVYKDTRYVEEPELCDRVRTFFRANGKGQSNNVIGNVVPIVQNLAHKRITVYKEMPFYAGRDAFPSPRNIIAYRNGLLDVEKYLAGDHTLIPHTPKWVSTVCLPYEFQPDAACPLWLRFLEEAFEGDESRQLLLQEWFGYCLTQDNSHQKFMWFKGPPGTGKGTAATVLRHLVGEENCVGYSLYRLAATHGLGMLVGKLVAICGEVDLAGSPYKYQILEYFKRITGNDPVDINEKYEKGYTCLLPTRFTILSNEHLNFVDHTGALDRRMLPVNFDRVALDPDQDLPAKLLAEISGINAWALQGLVRLKQAGSFTETESGQKLRIETRRHGSHVFAFLQDCCVVQSTVNPGNLQGVKVSDRPCWVTGQELKGAYLDWCIAHDVEKPNMVNFGVNLSSILPKVTSKPRRIGGKLVRGYEGLGLLSASDKNAVQPLNGHLQSGEAAPQALNRDQVAVRRDQEIAVKMLADLFPETSA